MTGQAIQRFAAKDDRDDRSYSNIYPRFLFVDVGFNMRPLDLCACIGRRQLSRLEISNANRRHNYKAIYDRLRECSGVYMPKPCDEIAYLALPLIFGKDLKKIQDILEDSGVQTRPLISGNFVRQPMMKTWGLDHPDPSIFTGAEQIHHSAIYIVTGGLRSIVMNWPLKL